ncbi:hypothetical protein [Sulfolobus tengchongensis spindle-shaped virus 3]|nr:hypothetical protein [Sulfolobus tengchongensis spindle-shaped virus 3]
MPRSPNILQNGKVPCLSVYLAILKGLGLFSVFSCFYCLCLLLPGLLNNLGHRVANHQSYLYHFISIRIRK